MVCTYSVISFNTDKRNLTVASPTILHRNLQIIEVAEPLLLDELMLDQQVSAMVLKRLSETVAVIDPSRHDALITRLRKLGHLPKSEA
jgi:hypothetical protein